MWPVLLPHDQPQNLSTSNIILYSLYYNLETMRLRGRPRNRRQNEAREDGRLVGGQG